jgi:hypothetical protein
MPPTFQHDAPVEWLALRGDNKAIVLAPCVGIMFTPSQLESFQVQLIQSKKQILRPLIAITALL